MGNIKITFTITTVFLTDTAVAVGSVLVSDLLLQGSESKAKKLFFSLADNSLFLHSCN